MNYLVRRGVDAAILQSMGKGDADPITDCPGGTATIALIACLASNRRVEVIINSKKIFIALDHAPRNRGAFVFWRPLIPNGCCAYASLDSISRFRC